MHPRDESTIPAAKIEVYVEAFLPDDTMPDRDEISEEGFGYFRGTWFMGRPLLEEVEDAIAYEKAVMDALDQSATGPAEFERLAKAVEDCYWADLPRDLAEAFAGSGLKDLIEDVDDLDPLGGLEIGVAGLSYVLSFLRCLTAASCRSHFERSWSDCPVVFFAAPPGNAKIAASIVGKSNCGMDADRDMLKIFGPSIRDTHALARRLLDERGRF